MNKTRHGRWNRYRITDSGVKQKKCNGPLHGPGTEDFVWLDLDQFWVFKKGPRAEKPHNWCKECTRVKRGRGYKKSGELPVSQYKWIFIELQRRLGKTETLRRLHMASGFWARLDKQKVFKKPTVLKAFQLLMEVRANNEVRHKTSIRHGAAARGHRELIPIHRTDYYIPTGDSDLQTRMKYRDEHLEQERASERKRYRRRKQASG